MRILVADDDLPYRELTSALLGSRGHEVVVAADGGEALAVLRGEEAPPLAILDWMMPGLTGPAVCEAVRALPWAVSSPYLILLTGKTEVGDLVTGLDSGADDYVRKPFSPAELVARVEVGLRVVKLQRTLAERVSELEASLGQIRRLRGLLPMCAYCKSIRDDQNYWKGVEAYLGELGPVQFSHGVCPSCRDTVVKRELDDLRAKLGAA